MKDTNDAAPDTSPLKKRSFIAALGVTFIVALLVYGAHWWTTGRFLQSTDDAYVGGNTTPMSPHISGFVSQIAITDNQFVKAGDLLLRLDGRDYQAAQAKARATLKEREASLVVLQARSARLEFTVKQLEATVAGAVARATYAGHNASRYHGLAARNASPEQEAERTLSENRSAQAEVDADKAALAGARQDLHVVATEIVQAQASVEQAQADMRQADLNLGYTEIRAPIDGYVGNRVAQTGSFVTSGMYLLSIVPAYGLWIDANFKEDQLQHMRVGQVAEITADILPGQRLHGRVLSLAPGTGAIFSVIPPENATGNFTKIVQRIPVRIILEDHDARLGRLRPGLSTFVTVETKPSVESQP